MGDMISGKLSAAVLVAISVAGCQSAGTRDRLSTHLNKSMAEFSQSTGWVPSSFYNTDAGRVFVVDGPTSVHFNPGYRGNYVRTAPSVSTYSCRLLITTKPRNGRGNADTWIIKAIDWRGNC